MFTMSVFMNYVFYWYHDIYINRYISIDDYRKQKISISLIISV